MRNQFYRIVFEIQFKSSEKKFSQTTMVMEKEQKAHKKWSLFSFILTLATKTLVCKGPIMFKLAKNDGLNPYVLKSCC